MMGMLPTTGSTRTPVFLHTFLFWFLLGSLMLATDKGGLVTAVLQTGQLDVYLGSAFSSAAPFSTTTSTVATGTVDPPVPSYTMLASLAFFGTWPAMKGTEPKNSSPFGLETLRLPPSDNPLLCESVSDAVNPSAAAAFSDNYQNSVLLVPRGNCTFEQKAYHAQRMGAHAVLIYGTLASRYTLNISNSTSAQHEYTTDDIVHPLPYVDYDCSKGRAEIPRNQIQFDFPSAGDHPTSFLPYNAEHNDPLLSGEKSSNLCLSNSPDHLSNCPSKACFLTGRPINSSSGTPMVEEACCAWDLPIWLYADSVNFNATDHLVKIPAAYLTMEQGQRLLQDLAEYNTNGGRGPQVQVVLSQRWRSNANASSYLIWALGVLVAGLASYLSAGEYHGLLKKARKRLQEQSNRQQQPSVPRRRRPAAAAASQQQEESVELTAAHAVGFIVMATTSLLVLFYFKIYKIVKVLYALGCSKAVSQIILDPLLKWFMTSAKIHNIVLWKSNSNNNNNIVNNDVDDDNAGSSPPSPSCIEEILGGDCITLRDVVSHLLGYALGISWLVVALTVRHPETMAFFWIVQDVFGACMCILFLQVIKVNSLHVASVLLCVAFFYDIFFVFLSPLLFSKSVMITVATSGGPPVRDESWCEKYPDDANCQGGDPLPMLFTIPRLFDYQGGVSLLGLGDIVLPGLLLSLAARLDAAKSLLGVMGGGNGRLNSPNHHSCPGERQLFCCRHPSSPSSCHRFLCSSGYFAPVVVAYGVGLFMANAAVYLMNMGQPALLYLVPCCLGTMSFLGWRRGELKDLWVGPKAIRAADNILYGNQHGSNHHHAPLPVEEEGVGDDYDSLSSSSRVPSAVADQEDGYNDRPEAEEGDVSLLAESQQGSS